MRRHIAYITYVLKAQEVVYISYFPAAKSCLLFKIYKGVKEAASSHKSYYSSENGMKDVHDLVKC